MNQKNTDIPKFVPCPFCEKTSAKFWFIKDNFNLYRCKKCKLIFIHPLPQTVNNIYSKNYFCGAKQGRGYVNYDEDKKSDLPTFHSYLDRIEKTAATGGQLLDIGAATGTFLEVARQRGWQTKGVEISAYAAAEGVKKNLDIVAGTIQTARLNHNFFDVITLWDVFEHVENPKKEIEDISDLLKPNGVIAMNLPDTGSLFAKISGKFWPLLLPPEHIHLFSKKGLINLLERKGYKILITDRIGKKFKPAYILQILSTVKKQKIWKILSQVIEKTPLNKILIPLNLRDNLFIIVQKKN